MDNHEQANPTNPGHRESRAAHIYEQMCLQSWMNTTLGSQPTTRPSRVTYTS
jgi:hypothetical protein